MKPFSVVLALAFLGGCAVAFAAERTVGQKGLRFSERHVTLRAGDSLIFINDDKYPHNVVSKSEGNAFDLGLQQPGTQDLVIFHTPGEVLVTCALHPRMKMTVTVMK